MPWPGSRSCPGIPSTGRPGLTWNGGPAATPPPGSTTNRPLRWPGARPSACPSSGGSRAWESPSACPVSAPAIRPPGEDQQPGGEMNDLLEAAVAAHGGLDRWNQVKSITVGASITGALWSLKGQDDALKDVRFEVDTTRERLTMDFTGQDKRSVFEPRRVVLRRH